MIDGHHRWRCDNANLPSFVLLNGVADGTLRTEPAVPAPALALMPLLALRPVPVPGRSSIGGKRSLSISDLRLSYEQSPILRITATKG